MSLCLGKGEAALSAFASRKQRLFAERKATVPGEAATRCAARRETRPPGVHPLVGGCPFVPNCPIDCRADEWRVQVWDRGERQLYPRTPSLSPTMKVLERGHACRGGEGEGVRSSPTNSQRIWAGLPGGRAFPSVL